MPRCGAAFPGLAESAHADPDNIGAPIDLFGVPWLRIGEKPSAVQIGGNARSHHHRRCDTR
jgi:hypothetical protein